MFINIFNKGSKGAIFLLSDIRVVNKRFCAGRFYIGVAQQVFAHTEFRVWISELLQASQQAARECVYARKLEIGILFFVEVLVEEMRCNFDRLGHENSG